MNNDSSMRSALLGVRNKMGCWCVTPFVNISEDRDHEPRCKAVFAALKEPDAATSMRSLCVEKVSEILNQLMIELPPISDSYLKGQGWNSALARANNEIVPALESLSIQDQKS